MGQVAAFFLLAETTPVRHWNQPAPLTLIPHDKQQHIKCSEGQRQMFKGLLLWMIGIPLPLIILLLIFVL